MARIVPDGWREVGAAGAAQREIDTLAQLARGLPDSYTVYHAVHWTNVEHGYSIYGEVDFAVVNLAGELLLIEQTAGLLEETGDGLAKKYPDKLRNLPVRIAQSVHTLRTRLAKRPQLSPPRALRSLPAEGAASAVARPGEVQTDPPRVEYLLYCPDYTVRHPDTAGIAPERIVDATRRDRLCAVIQQILPDSPPAAQAQQTHRFLNDIIQLQPDTSALVGQARAIVTRIAGGLAHWARELEFEPFRLRVIGTAGSGKTQLALAEYRDAIEAGKRPLYVCFNRPLADHFVEIAPEGGLACTFHTLCDQVLQASGGQVDFSRPNAFAGLIEQAAELTVPDALKFDTVIVDEGQDFTEQWRDLVLRHGKPGARCIWLEDPMQNLYDKPQVALPGWVTLHTNTNYRSPRSVVQALQLLLPDDIRIEPAGPIAAADLDVLVYDNEAELIAHTKKAISQCLAAGFKRNEIAVVSFRGRENSTLLSQTQLGPHSLRGFTGKYDLLGQPEFSEGEVLIESVYRFKGQAAPAIVFTEIDFAQLDRKTVRKLFVGATRAMLKLVVVASRRSAQGWLSVAPPPDGPA